MSTYDLGEITVYIVTDATGFERGISRARNVMTDFQRSMQIAAGVLMRDLFYGFVGIIREATELGAEVETLKNSFDSFTDAADAQWLTLDKLRTATMGMVSDVDLLTQANRMLSAGMPVDQIEELFSGAIKLGKAMGIDAATAIEKVTLGLVRQSWRLMDDLGIIMRANEAYKQYAERIGTTTDKLTAQQKQLAWIIYGTDALTDRVEVLGDNIGEADKMLDQFTATLKNVYTSIGENIAAIPALTMLVNALAPAIGIGLAGQLNAMATAAAVAGAKLTGLQMAAAMGVAIAPYAAFALVVALLPTAIKGYSMALHDLRMSTDSVYASQQRLVDATEALVLAEIRADDAAAAYTDAQRNEVQAYSALISAADAYGDALARQQEIEDELEQAQRSRAVAQANFASALEYARGVTESYREAQTDTIWVTREAEQTYLSLRGTLWGLEDSYASLSDEIRVLQDTHRALSDELYNMRESHEGVANKIALEQYSLNKLTLSYHEGKISQEEYEEQAEKIRLRLERLRLTQEKYRIDESKLEDKVGDASREVELQERQLSDLGDEIDETKDRMSTLVTENDTLLGIINDVKNLQNELVEATQDLNKAYGDIQTSLDTYKEAQIKLGEAYEAQATALRDVITLENYRAEQQRKLAEEERQRREEREEWERRAWPEDISPPSTPYTEPTTWTPPTGLPVPAGNYEVYQRGGIVTRPTLGLLGEAGPEAVIPLSRMGSAQPSTFVVNIAVESLIGTDEAHAEEFARLSADNFMRQLEKRGVKF